MRVKDPAVAPMVNVPFSSVAADDTSLPAWLANAHSAPGTGVAPSAVVTVPLTYDLGIGEVQNLGFIEFIEFRVSASCSTRCVFND